MDVYLELALDQVFANVKQDTLDLIAVNPSFVHKVLNVYWVLAIPITALVTIAELVEEPTATNVLVLIQPNMLELFVI